MKACIRGVLRQWHWLFFAAVVLLTIGMDVFVAHNILDGDASDHMLRGWIIAQEKNPFTRNYYYTTEVSLPGIGWFFSLFFFFLSDWSMVRICGTLTLQALFVLSFLYLCKRAHIGSLRARVVTAALLLLPFSVPYARIVLYHLYYALYLTNAFWMVGLTLGLMEVRGARKAALPVCLLAVLWFVAGLNGIRHMMILGAPLLAFAVVQVLLALRRYRWEKGKLVGGEPFLRSDAMRLVWILTGSFLFFLIGYALNIKVLLPYYGIRDSSATFFFPSESAEHYADIFNSWLIATGVRSSNLPTVGIAGISLLAALISFGYLLCASASNVWDMSVPVASRVAPALLSAAFVTTTLIFIFDSTWRYYPLYYVPVVAFAYPALATELARLKESAVSACRKLLILLTCMCFLFQGAYTVYYISIDRWDMDSWTGLFDQDIFLADTARVYANFMEENGYTHALAPYWYANVMMELTDGKLTVGSIELDENEGKLVLRAGKWATSKAAFERENLPERLLVFIEEDYVKRFEESFPHFPRVFEYWHTCAYEITPDVLF
ncbi:MAG TPA: hypothetical protein IAC11_05280 [Candidatus Limiplasma pullicola]|nr:hypothetical protein [Candidatus Limiplasma pullicola]